jgi:exopolyphosphatase/guanosine-5'-triphosphate,3'-diphosphate pyrophosphatase
MERAEIKEPSRPILPVAPPFIRRAVIDIGTNSVKILVGDVNGTQVLPVFEASEQTRLGRGFYETHILQSEAISQTATAVAYFAAEARRIGAENVRVIATSAARDAKNADDLTDAVRSASGLQIEVISGEQEADWAFQGVTTGTDLASGAVLILDVGGGSSEFILGHHGHAHFRESFQIGTVRLLERNPTSDPPSKEQLAACRLTIREFLQGKVRPKLEGPLGNSAEALQLVGTGGTTTVAARMKHSMTGFDRETIEKTRLSRSEMHKMTETLWKMPLIQRQEIPGLPKNRADVILMGIAIYEGIMDEFSLAELRVSTRGLRYAALMQI